VVAVVEDRAAGAVDEEDAELRVGDVLDVRERSLLVRVGVRDGRDLGTAGVEHGGGDAVGEPRRGAEERRAERPVAGGGDGGDPGGGGEDAADAGARELLREAAGDDRLRERGEPVGGGDVDELLLRPVEARRPPLDEPVEEVVGRRDGRREVSAYQTIVAAAAVGRVSSDASPFALTPFGRGVVVRFAWIAAASASVSVPVPHANQRTSPSNCEPVEKFPMSKFPATIVGVDDGTAFVNAPPLTDTAISPAL
jgi:hypothetical protein